MQLLLFPHSSIPEKDMRDDRLLFVNVKLLCVLSSYVLQTVGKAMLTQPYVMGRRNHADKHMVMICTNSKASLSF